MECWSETLDSPSEFENCLSWMSVGMELVVLRGSEASEGRLPAQISGPDAKQSHEQASEWVHPSSDAAS